MISVRQVRGRVRGLGSIATTLNQQSQTFNNLSTRTLSSLVSQVQLPTDLRQTQVVDSFEQQAGGGSLPGNDAGILPLPPGVELINPDGTPNQAAVVEGSVSEISPSVASSGGSFWRAWGPPILVVGGVGLAVWILRRKRK